MDDSFAAFLRENPVAHTWLAIGLLLVAASTFLYTTYWKIRFSFRRIRATGRIEDIKTSISEEPDYRDHTSSVFSKRKMTVYTRHFTISFPLDNGTRHTTIFTTKGEKRGPSKWQEGDEVKLSYDPDDPDTVVLSIDYWTTPFIAGLITLVAALYVIKRLGL